MRNVFLGLLLTAGLCLCKQNVQPGCYADLGTGKPLTSETLCEWVAIPDFEISGMEGKHVALFNTSTFTTTKMVNFTAPDEGSFQTFHLDPLEMDVKELTYLGEKGHVTFVITDNEFTAKTNVTKPAEGGLKIYVKYDIVRLGKVVSQSDNPNLNGKDFTEFFAHHVISYYNQLLATEWLITFGETDFEDIAKEVLKSWADEIRRNNE